MCFLTERGSTNASILYEVPKKGGYQGPEVNHDEEWPAGHSGRVPEMQHQSI